MTLLDENVFLAKKEEVDENSGLLKDMITQIIDKICEPLDRLMYAVYQDIIANGVETATDAAIEQKFAELSNCLYFVNEAADKLSINEGISKIGMKTAYNTAYLNPDLDKPKPTIAELQASAENKALYDSAVNEAYSKAYKMIKSKIEAGQTMLSTLSKILSRRMTQKEVSDRIPVTKHQILNEGMEENYIERGYTFV